MLQLDDRILEHVRSEGWSSPRVMKRCTCLRAGVGTIRDRCRYLVYAGLLAPIAGETYEITAEGIAYLDGRIDAEHRPWPTPGRALRG